MNRKSILALILVTMLMVSVSLIGCGRKVGTGSGTNGGAGTNSGTSGGSGTGTGSGTSNNGTMKEDIKGAADAVKTTLDDIAKNEASAFSFTSILFGVGDDSSFERAQKLMGIQHLAKVGNTGAEIRKMINFISSSISKSSSGANPLDVTF